MTTQINIDDVTDGNIGGIGIFDKLMTVVGSHVKEEFANDRINSSDYATVYLGSLQSVLTQAIQFSLTKDKAGADADKALKDIEIAEATKLKIECETSQCAKKTLQIIEQTTGIVQQREKTAKELLIMDQDIILKQKDVLLRDKDLLHRDKDLLIKDQDILLSQAKVINMSKQNDLLTQTILKSVQEVSVMEQEVLLMQAKVLKMGNDAILAAKHILLAEKELVLMDKKILLMVQDVAKATAEVSLMAVEEIKLIKEVDYLTAQIADITARHATIVHEIAKMQAESQLMIAKKNIEILKLTLMGKEISKADAQILLLGDNHTMNLLDQTGKVTSNLILTEKKNVEAQRYQLMIKQTTAEGIKYLGGANSDSIMGAQMRLLKNQGTSYRAKVYETRAKLYSDMYSVSKTQDDAVGSVTQAAATNKVDTLTTAINLFS